MFRGRIVSPTKNQLFLMAPSCMRVQDAVHLGHHIFTINKDSLVADGIA